MAASDTYANNIGAIYRELGRSQAQARLQSGAGWANTLGQIGQIAASVPGQLADERRSRQQEAIWQANLDEFNQQKKEHQWLADAMNSSVGPDGQIDERRLAENLQLLGAAQLAPKAIQTIREAKRASVELDNAIQTGQINQQTLAEGQMQVLAKYAPALLEAEGDPTVLNGVLAAIRLDPRLGPQMADGLKQEIANDPAAVFPFVQTLVQPKAPKPSVAVGKDQGLWNPNTGTWDVERPTPAPDEPKSLEQLITQAQVRLGNATTPAERAAAREQINEAVKTKAALERAGQTGSAPSYQWVTLPDGRQKLMSVDEIRATPGAAPPSASRSADAPASVKSDLASIGTLSDMLTQIETIGKKHNWEGIGGMGVGTLNDFMRKNFGKGSEEGQSLRNTISNVLGEIAKLRGGTAFTAQEQQLLERYTPTINESAASVAGKVKSLREFLATKRRNIEQQFMGGAPARAGGAGAGGGSPDPLGIRRGGG